MWPELDQDARPLVVQDKAAVNVIIKLSTTRLVATRKGNPLSKSSNTLALYTAPSSNLVVDKQNLPTTNSTTRQSRLSQTRPNIFNLEQSDPWRVSSRKACTARLLPLLVGASSVHPHLLAKQVTQHNPLSSAMDVYSSP
eukprot:1398948-Amphidinium_carterae.1